MSSPDRQKDTLTSRTFYSPFVKTMLLLLTLVTGMSQTSVQAQVPRRLAPPQRSRPSASAARKRAVGRNGHKSVKTSPGKAKSRAGSATSVYRSGHGNRGIGTIKPPSRYTAPLTVPSPEVAATHPAIEFPAQLAALFTHLQTLEGSPGDHTTRILQFGDSHTAADMFTGRMRLLMQQRFGNGGAGFTFAGHPFPGYRILGTSRAQSSGWIDEGVHFTRIVNTELGLGGVANTSTRPGDAVTLDAPCTRMELHYLDQPGGGSFSLSEDGEKMVELSTDSTLKATQDIQPETLTETCSPGTMHHFEVTADSARPVRLFGFVTEQPGITYEALGLNGAEAAQILRWDQPIFTGYLRQREPGLIILAYGTNEASNHNWTYEAYRDLMGRLVDTLHQTVPDASVLIIGPPDRSLRVGRRRSAHWQTFTETVHITEAQRDVCRTHGCAIWDWRARMGGLGSMNRWATSGLAQPDHTHFTSAGYVQLADLFYSDIIAAYELWKEQNPPSSMPVSSSERRR